MRPFTCGCTAVSHTTRRIVFTGGPGAGKTAAIEAVRHMTCPHVVVLPESAGMLFSGGFPRGDSKEARKCAQRAIGHVQMELERIASETAPAILLCDRGVVDGLAYWPGEEGELLLALGLDRPAALARYDLVIHLAVPTIGHGYDRSNRIRTETASEAAAIDRRITEAWRGHPNVVTIESSLDFSHKLSAALELVKRELPACCSGPVRSSYG